MEFAFPPVPPHYWIVIAARCVLVAWSLIGLGIVANRVRHWKAVQPTEIPRWGAAAAIGCVVAFFGFCSKTVYDDNAWNIPVFVAAMSVSIAGVAVCLAKVYAEGTSQEKRHWIGGTVTTGIAIWFVLALVFLDTGYRHPAEASRSQQCKNNLKQIGFAMHNWHDERQAFPPPATGTIPVSWRVALLPYMDESKVYNRYDRKLAWNQGSNLALAHESVGALVCPSSYQLRDTEGLCYTAYSMLTGPHSVGGNPSGTKLREIRDGTSNTMMVVEACGAQIVWSEPRDVNIADDPAGINLKGYRHGHSRGWMSSYHSHGANMLLADGSVRWVSSKTDPAVLRKQASIDDGDEGSY